MVHQRSSSRQTRLSIYSLDSLSTSISLLNSSTSSSKQGYIKIDDTYLYEYLLRVCILSYRTEPRFRVPLPIQQSNISSLDPKSKSPKRSHTHLHGHARSKTHDFINIRPTTTYYDYKLPKDIIEVLLIRLNKIAMKQDYKFKIINQDTRRCFLVFYGNLMNKDIQKKIQNMRQPEELVMLFISCANKELTKLNVENLTNVVHLQTSEFIHFLINILTTDYDKRDYLVEKLKEFEDTLIIKNHTNNTLNSNGNGKNNHFTHNSMDNVLTKTSTRSSISSFQTITSSQTIKYPIPSFKQDDMILIQTLGLIFNKSKDDLQNDIDRLKSYSIELKLESDINKLLNDLNLNKCEKLWIPDDFNTIENYEKWKENEIKSLMLLLDQKKHLPIVNNENEDFLIDKFFYFIPDQPKDYYNSLLIKILQSQSISIDNNCNDNEENLLFTKSSLDFLNEVAKIWRIDYITRAISFIDASDKTILSSSSYLEDGIDLDKLKDVFNFSKRIIEIGKLNWDFNTWNKKSQEIYGNFLYKLYLKIMEEIRKLLLKIFNDKLNKPKFKPYLNFLEDYIENDLIFNIVYSKINFKKILKKFQKTIFKISGEKYDEYLSKIPRDNTLSTLHILQLGETIISQAQKIQKRYPMPLLGEIYISKIVIQCQSSLYCNDSETMLKYLISNQLSKNELMTFDESIQLYNILSQIRDLYYQVYSSSSKTFKFNLEDFFENFIKDWAEHSCELTLNFINESLKKDNFLPLNDNENQLYSSSVIDIFTSFRATSTILSNLNWKNEYQLSKFYTIIIKGISNGLLLYSNNLIDLFLNELGTINDIATKKNIIYESRHDKWIAGVKSVINGKERPIPEIYQFQAKTCIKLNDISFTLEQLDQFEEKINPSKLSNIIKKMEKNSNERSNYLFNIRIIRAEGLKACDMNGLSDPYITLLDTSTGRTIGKTNTIYEDLNPYWDETFEIICNRPITLTATVWDENTIGNHDICGRSLIQLDGLKFKESIAREIWLDLDTQGRILFSISVENEKDDIQFYFGKSFRTLMRVEDRMIMSMVNKFTAYIQYTLSIDVIKMVSKGNKSSSLSIEKMSNWLNNNGNNNKIIKEKEKPSTLDIKDAIIPLYDYLNANFKILAKYLTHDLLIKVMTKTWDVVLKIADSLLLPPLIKKKSKKKILSSFECEIVFIWLRSLCNEFFYNNGEGPSLETLQNNKYQELMLVPAYYDNDTYSLKQEVDNLTPMTMKMMNEKKFISFDQLVKRNNTVMGHRNRKVVAKTEKQIAEVRRKMPHEDDIILRILLVRGETDFVFRRLKQREKISRSLATERMARAAADGTFSNFR